MQPIAQVVVNVVPNGQGGNTIQVLTPNGMSKLAATRILAGGINALQETLEREEAAKQKEEGPAIEIAVEGQIPPAPRRFLNGRQARN